MKNTLLLGVVFVIAAAGAFSMLESKSELIRHVTSSATRVFHAPKEIRVLFVGDLMFDRYIRTVLEQHGEEAVLGDVASLLSEADLTVGNLEGPITDHPSQSQGTKVGDLTNMRFTFSPSVAKLLHAYGFDLVSIGNNHIRDFGEEGVESTIAYLEGADIAVVGDIAPEPVIRDVEGVRLAFVSYSDFVRGDAERALHAIERAEADAVIVLAHWGTEYESEPPARIRELARSFVLAGADLVIGSHPHVIGTVEDIGTARVYYSLGNFVFDQYWEPSVRCGLAVTATFRKEKEGTRIEYDETRVGMSTDGSTVLGCR